MKNPLHWLLGKRKRKGLAGCSVEELRQIRSEADYLAAAVDSKKGELPPDDMERLKRLKETLENLNEDDR